MARVKDGKVTKAKHKKILKQAKGYFGSKHRLYKSANEQVMHAGKYAYRDRRQKKRDFRKLWITRINAACRLKAGIEINRKMLSEVAIDNPALFTELVNTAKAALEGKVEAPVKEVKAEKKETAKKETVKKEEKADLNSMTVAELRELAKAKDVKGAATMKKAELIDALK